MAAYNKFNSFVEAVAEKAHNLGADQLVVALTNTAPAATNTALADITEVAYTNLSTRNITTTSSAQTAGTYKLTLTDLVLTAGATAIGPFRYAVIYNDTSTGDLLIAWYDYGSAITLQTGETLTLDFDGSAGFLTIA